jgi:2-polyprenyl-3-methyl-5-hydroxy-6-metoxy-1,4-benzoquinol methylase
MSAVAVDAARRARGAYGHLGRGDRFHTAVRWRTCPFPAVEAAVPRVGRVLDLGCGHGLFSLFLAAAGPEREVVGVDIDADKLVSARQAADDAGLEVRFEEAPDGRVPAGPWDAITIVDVLYLLGEPAALDLVGRAAAEVGPGGVLAVKEMAVRPRWKYELARAQELVATRVLRITEGDEVAIVPPDDIAAAMAAAGLEVEHRRLDRHAPHPHLLLLGRRPAADREAPASAD